MAGSRALGWTIIVALVSVSLCLLARGAAAADEEAPEVVGPADMPGADVIWYQGEEYTLNATGSKDDTGIVAYSWRSRAPTRRR